MVNWTSYLESLCNEYEQWRECYTVTDVVGHQRVEQKTSRLRSNLDLKAKMVQPKKEESGERQEKTERFGVLEGLRKYAKEHVLLVGRPGSGKSTALIQLLLEEANSCTASILGVSDLSGQDTYPTIQNVNKQPKIPILVELRYWKDSVENPILDLIRSFLKQHGLLLDKAEIEKLLFEQQFLLLLDGVNELPSEAARVDLKVFRRENAATPMIFTSREGVGEDLDIAHKLEMQPLTEVQIEEFVRAYLGNNAEEMLWQLKDRKRKFSETPLLLWMLCRVYVEQAKIPENLGSAFQEFSSIYDNKLKADVPVYKNSRSWWSELLQQLAFNMIPVEGLIPILNISKHKAEEILTQFLECEKFDKPRDYAKRWLEDLLEHHLIQYTNNDKIEFRHQLIQEYYTAESLLKQLPHLLRDEYRLKWEHLNYLKWTEPLALMLELVEDGKQAFRIVQLAQEVDLRLSAKLAGAVKPDLQAQTVGLITGLEIPSKIKIQLLGITRSEEAIPCIQPALNDEDYDVCNKAAEALVNIGSEGAVIALKQTLNYEDYNASHNAISALKKIDSQAAIDALKPFLRHKDLSVRVKMMLPTVFKELFSKSKPIFSELSEKLEQTKNSQKRFYAPSQIFYDDDDIGNENDIYNKVANFLKKIGSPTTIDEWKQALNHEDYDVRCHAVYALGDIGSEAAIEQLKLALQHEDSNVRISAIYALGNIRSKAAFEQLKLALKHEDADVRRSVVYVLDQISEKAELDELKLALNDEEPDVRRSAAFALGKIGDKAALEELKLALNDKEPDVRKIAASTLGNINSEVAIEALQNVLTNDAEADVRSISASALGNIGLEAGIEALQNALNNDKEPDVRRSITFALGNISSEAAIKALRNALNDEDFNVRREAAGGLGKIASPDLMPEFNNILRTNTEINWLETIAAVQERCKFYNYDIYQSPPPPLAQPTDSNVPTHVHNRIIYTSGGNYIESNTGTYVQGDYINSTSTSGGD
jgi:HEAT repeat protein